MDEPDELLHGNQLVVEVTVRAGGDVGIEYSSTIRVKRAQATTALNDLARTLLNALPLKDIQDTEHLLKRDLTPVVMEDGSIKYIPKTLERAVLGQAELRARMSKKDGKEPST